jgi:hypothetical protein
MEMEVSDYRSGSGPSNRLEDRMITKIIEPRMFVSSTGVKSFDIVQLTKYGTRTISRATLASGLDFNQAVTYAEGIAKEVSTYQAMKGDHNV